MQLAVDKLKHAAYILLDLLFLYSFYFNKLFLCVYSRLDLLLLQPRPIWHNIFQPRFRQCTIQLCPTFGN